jgi:two-component system chemotaxis sensor kinase CheA
MNEFLEQFLVECRELVEAATHDLLALEERPGDRERLDGAFRAFHTLKGAAGIVDFNAMGLTLHAAESVLSALRAGSAPVTPMVIGDCLTCLDQVVLWLDAIQATGEPPADAQASADVIIARFGAAASNGPGGEADVPTVAVGAAPPADLDPVAEQVLRAQIAMLDDPAGAVSWGRTVSAGRVAVNVLRRLGRRVDADRLEPLATGPASSGDPQVLRDALRGLLDGGAIPRAAEPTAQRDPVEPSARGLRVDVERVDALVNLVGELTVAKNALGHAAALARSGAEAGVVAAVLRDQHAQLERLLADLQRAVLSIRVLPLRQVFQRFPRLVREMVVTLGKPVRLVTEGDATEADKAIVESLFEPLLHVIRNALDHGIEPAAVRAAAGKAPSAIIELRAAQVGERVVVEVTDDGGGIDIARVGEVAVRRGVVTAEALADMSEEAVVELIFAPGFSTSDQVSALSGRGVGMDAVRTAVERLGGRVSVVSRAGEGTTVRFDLPFAVMMSRVLSVEVGGQLFGLPMEAVIETVHVTPRHVVPIGAARAFVLRDRTLPLIGLAEILGDAAETPAADDRKVVIVSAAGRLGGLQVDRLGDPMDVMLKPLGGLLAATPGVAGTSLLGDGRVLIVLDLAALFV